MSGQKLTGHTPGPWEDADNGWIDAADGSSVVEYDGCGSHAACWVNASDKRLAIAAPEMLSALLRIHAHGYTNGDDWNLVRDAITKATGVEPND